MTHAPSDAPILWLLRHGETEWSRSGQHTGRTDIPLTKLGRAQAKQLAAPLADVHFTAIFESPRERAQHTCELAGCASRPGVSPIIDADLAEWDYGEYEGITSAKIHEQRPDWFLWTDGAPGGESPDAICARVDRLLARLATQRGDVALFAHGHVLRVIALRYLGWPLEQGAQLGLDTATIGKLGVLAGRPSLLTWNRPAMP